MMQNYVQAEPLTPSGLGRSLAEKMRNKFLPLCNSAINQKLPLGWETCSANLIKCHFSYLTQPKSKQLTNYKEILRFNGSDQYW